jgi:hypothetical protein
MKKEFKRIYGIIRAVNSGYNTGRADWLDSLYLAALAAHCRGMRISFYPWADFACRWQAVRD